MARVYTEKQTAAIETRDRTLLVSAAAGSGKTATLTERIIRSILDESDPISISDMLIVTFTKAATGELKERIAAAIKAKLAERPGDGRLESQLHMLASAHISTIDSFCSDILRANCDRVGVNPAYRIADEAEAELLAESILDGMFSDIYDGALCDVATPEELEQLSDCLTDTRDQDELSVVLRMFYTSVADTEAGVGTIRGLVEEYNTEAFSTVENCRFGAHTVLVAHEFAEHYRPIIAERLEAHIAACDAKCQRRIDVLTGDLAYLDRVLATGTYDGLRTLMREVALPTTPQLRAHEELSNLSGIRQAMKKAQSDIAQRFFEHSCESWVESYSALYRILSVLVRILEKFDELFRREKLRLGICEYSDVARYTYECLWQGGERTDVALAEAAKWRAVYVDEYQDVNGVQHKIFEAISTPTNRFMVGDIKQSIYGFRSADPTIFAAMKGKFPELGTVGDYPAASIFMSDNFRCDRGVIDFVNGIFDKLFEVLRESIGYVTADRLIYKKVYPEGREPEYRTPELCLLPYGGMESIVASDGEELDAAPMLVAEKISALLEHGTLSSGAPVRPGDIAIILRNAKGKDKKYAAALEALGIPSALPDTASFFLNPEILLIMSILNTIDNPRRDVYLTATLMSPIFGFTADELAAIAGMGEPSLYDSLIAFTGENPDFSRGKRFLSWLEKYRVYSEGCAVDVLINRIYRDTGLLALASRDGGKEHLLRFYEHARQYESSTLRGLYSFLGYVNSIIDRKNAFDKREAVTGGDTVKILTAHSSKGLEFPIVFFVGTDQSMKRSREEDDRLVYDSKFGIAMYLRTPSGLSLVKNPTKSVVMDYKLRRKIEEEARLLYVILTRAREQLYLVGKSRSGYDGYKEKIAEANEHLTPYTVYGMKNYTDMVTYSTGMSFMTPEEFLPGMSDELRAAIYPPEQEDMGECSDEGFVMPDELPSELIPESDVSVCDGLSVCSDAELGALADELYRRFTFEYPNAHLAHLPEKLSVSRLYPEVLDPSRDEEAVLDGEESKVKYTKMGKLPRFATGSDETESAKRGIATHLFFQFCDLRATKEKGARAELDRLVAEKYISVDDAKRVRINEVEAFRHSPLLSDMLDASRLWRELRFNTRLPATMFATDEELLPRLEGEEILVQGVIDCLIEDSEGELHLIDYKTDRLTREERENPELAEARLRASHSLQLSYYAAAIERMLGKRPVTVEVYSLHLGRCVDVMIKEHK